MTSDSPPLTDFDFPELVAKALNETADGSVARMLLEQNGTELQISALRMEDVPLQGPGEELTQLLPVAPVQNDFMGISLPIELKSRVSYTAAPTQKGGILHVEAPHDVAGTAHLELSVEPFRSIDSENLSVSGPPSLQLEKAWDRVNSALKEASEDSSANAEFTAHREIQNLREGAERQLENAKERAKELLSLMRRILAGWLTVALNKASSVSKPAGDVRGRCLRPFSDFEEDSNTRGDSNIKEDYEIRQDQRKIVSEACGRERLLALEIEKLWEGICERSLTELQFTAIANGLDVPSAITDATAKALNCTYESLKEKDEEILFSQALVSICDLMEARVIEKGDIFSAENLTNEDSKNRSSKEHHRTIKIGEALIDHIKEHGDYPEPESKQRFLVRAGNVINRGRSTAYQALDGTGCYVTGKRGKTGKGLQETMQAIVKYTKEHREVSS